jgi:hypothetical protein
VSTVTRKKITELIRLLEEWQAFQGSPPTPGSLMWAKLSEYETSLLGEIASILKGYLRVLIMIGQFRVTLIAFFSHYPELFGEQDDKGPYG